VRKLLALLLLILCFALAGAQTAKKQDEGFMGWVQGAWKTVQEKGKAGADQIAKQIPKKFQEVKSAVADVNKKVHDKIDSMNLQQKKDMLVELWRIRKSVDIMMLLKPEVLHTVTGLDTTGLKSLITTVTNLQSMVQKRIDAR